MLYEVITGLTFLLATLFIVATLHTYANLAGLGIHAVHARPAFPGQHTEFELLLERGARREHIGLSLHWPDSAAVRARTQRMPRPPTNSTMTSSRATSLATRSGP